VRKQLTGDMTLLWILMIALVYGGIICAIIGLCISDKRLLLGLVALPVCLVLDGVSMVIE